MTPLTPRQTLDLIIQATLAAVEPAAAVRRAVQLAGRELVVDGRRYDLARYGRVLIVGAGKAAVPMTRALEDLLAPGGLPILGAVVTKYGHGGEPRLLRIFEAGHPIPDSAGVQASASLAQLLAEAGADDLVLFALSGGASALLTLPREGLTLADLQATTDVLLRSGASIFELNAVRKHLDQVKGGGAARLAAPATLVTLVLSDVVGSPLDVIGSGPTVPDASTWQDAVDVATARSIWDQLPLAVRRVLAEGTAGRLPETPKPGTSLTWGQTVIVADNVTACDAAAAEAGRLGLDARVLTTSLQGEAREVGLVLAGVVRQMALSGQPLHPPCCLVAGGETSVTVRGTGLGGRNQELALSAARLLDGLPGVLLASLGTDGGDGPTPAAGAWIDGQTLARGGLAGRSLATDLANNDAYAYFQAADGLIVTGPTRTNVCDVALLLAF